jgi:hypothetical protein
MKGLAIMVEASTVKINVDRTESVKEDARKAVAKTDRGLGALHAAGYARGSIETLRNLGLFGAAEFNRLEHAVMIAEADADMAAEMSDEYDD